MQENFKSGFVTLDWKTECGKVNLNEPSDRTEDRNHVEQTADDKKPHPDSAYNRGGADCVCGHSGNP